MTLFKALSTVALALVLFVPAKTASSAEFPAGVSFRHIVGAVLEPHRGDKLWTTMDAVDFGFMTKYVRVCVRQASATVYLRLNTTVATAVPAASLLVFPAGSSAIFIDGTSGASFEFGALPMRAAVSENSSVGATGFGPQPQCVTEPWRTRGILAHIASGVATIDVWGYR